ncbi:hypothetical protein DPMN_142012 [Dreissena polymorpha]|uniref:Uncharacterized protein n=1 Tax=Dreissena polymorpha TaxID=45954 RepID=A0A9D4GDQ2_DREPO|nr:hypothetical protein DPMN_142012 [Dreissena polymorpha]
MVTTVMNTLQISTSATTILKYYRNDDNHRDESENHCKDNKNENECNDYKNDLNIDSNNGNNQDCVDYSYSTNNNAKNEDCYKHQAEDYLSDIDADYFNACIGNFYGYCLAGRKV